MTPRNRRRWRRYGIASAIHLLIVLAVLAIRPDETVALAVVVVATLPLLLAWGHVHADLSLNPDLDEASRIRWRLSTMFVPGGIAAYWLLYVR